MDPTWRGLNTLDMDAPVSRVTTLTAQPLSTFAASWPGMNKGSSIASYTVAVMSTSDSLSSTATIQLTVH